MARKNNSKSNSNDKEKERVLDFLTRTAEGIAAMFGSSCETLIHDMTRPGHPIVRIFNSHISGREVGSTADIFGDDMGVPQDDHWKTALTDDVVNSLAITNTDRYVKSTTIHYQGEGFHYALGINFDYTPLNNAMNVLQDLTNVSLDLNEHIQNTKSHSQLEDIFEECVNTIGKPVSSMKKNDRVQLIALLMKKDAFSFQKSVLYVAEQLNVSRYTVYKYCHEVEENINL